MAERYAGIQQCCLLQPGVGALAQKNVEFIHRNFENDLHPPTSGLRYPKDNAK